MFDVLCDSFEWSNILLSSTLPYSPGTGRTCTFIALDLCMRQFETLRTVDVMKTVYVIRQERAGAIQNKEQYILLYNVRVHLSAYVFLVCFD